MSGAWSYERVYEEEMSLRASMAAEIEMKIRTIAAEIVDGKQSSIVGDVFRIPVLGSRGVAANGFTSRYRTIEVRLPLLSDRDIELYIAEQQIYEQWHASEPN